MNELERAYGPAEPFGAAILVLLLRLWVILFCGFAGLWMVGVMIMFWWAAIPIALAGLGWCFFSSDVAHDVSETHIETANATCAFMPTNVPEARGDEQMARTPESEFRGFNSAQGSLT